MNFELRDLLFIYGILVFPFVISMVARNVQSLPDETLVEKFKATRNNEYFSEIFRRHRRKIFEMCLAFLGDRAAAEDLIQETFTKAFTDIDKFYEGNFYAWLRTIAKNMCINHLNDRIREGQKIQALVIEPGENPAADNTLLAEDIKTVLDKLDAKQRICIKMKHIDGYSYKEIAEITGFLEEEVKSYLQNGRRAFQNYWEHQRSSSIKTCGQ